MTDSVPSYSNSLFAFCERKPQDTVNKLHIMEIGNPSPGANKFKITADIQMAPDAIGDFPVLMQAAPKYGMIFIISKSGYLFLYESQTAALVYRQRISD
jgi:clathrin heavy chain